jgi:hypothetical protein
MGSIRALSLRMNGEGLHSRLFLREWAENKKATCSGGCWFTFLDFWFRFSGVLGLPDLSGVSWVLAKYQ